MLEFALPWAFIFLPLPWVIRYGVRRAPLNHRGALKIPFYDALVNMPQPLATTSTHKKTLHYLAYLTWLLLILASAGPQVLGDPIHLPRSGRDLMLALDLSGSMQIPDMRLNGKATDRLSVVKHVAKQFVAQRRGDRLGLILFGTRAYLQTPLTFDHQTVQHMLDDASISLAGPQTAIGDAIGLAIKRLKDTPQKSRLLILLTDGASNAGVLKPLQAAKLAAKEHIKIYTIGLGAKRLLMPGFLGPQLVNPSSDLDEGALKEIAKVTGGLFFRAQNTQDLRHIYQRIDQLEPIIRDKTVFRPIKPYYMWPLSLALLITLYLAWYHSRPWLLLLPRRSR